MKNKCAFTLVELIVVITILTVLSTIAFISFQGYGVSSRDSVRLADIKNTEKGLSILQTKGIKLPMPDTKIDIRAGSQIINYQGNAGLTLQGLIGVHGPVIDPLDGNFYTYTSNFQRNKYQLLFFLEGSHQTLYNLNKSFADFKERIPKVTGSNLGIVLDSSTNQPVQNISSGIDLYNTTSKYTVVLDNTHSGSISGVGSDLSENLDHIIFQNGSCNSILKNGNSKGNGFYKINPTGKREFEVYCNMLDHGGGWTLVWHGLPSEARFNDTTHESVAISGNIKFKEILADPFHTTDYHIEETSTMAVLQNTVRDYFYQIATQTNSTNPFVQFHDILGNQTVTINNMMYGYGNAYRVFAVGRNISYKIDYMYICERYGADQFTPLSIHDRVELGGTGTNNCYFNNEGDARNNIIHASESGLSLYKWQEMKVYVR